MVDTEYPRVIFRSGERLDNAFAERCGSTSAEKSAIAKRDLQRYYDALQAHMQTFSLDEALLLCSALNGVRCSPGTLYGNIAASEGIGVNTWHVDATALLDRIKNFSYMESLAVIDAVERAWNAPEYSIDLTKRVLLVGLAK